MPELDHVYTKFNFIIVAVIQLDQKEETINLSQSLSDEMTGL